MKSFLTCLGAAAVTAVIGLSAPASASPLAEGFQLHNTQGEYTQYVERRVIRRGPRGRIVERRVIRPDRRVCRTEVVRRETRRGVVVERVRRCR